MIKEANILYLCVDFIAMFLIYVNILLINFKNFIYTDV